MNVQALIGTDGEPAFVGEARCDSTHDLTAARADGIIDAVAEAGIETLADSGYQGADGTVRTPGKGHNGFEKRANRPHARHRAPCERGFALLKGRRIPRLVRISPARITALARAVPALTRQRSSLARA